MAATPREHSSVCSSALAGELTPWDNAGWQPLSGCDAASSYLLL